MQGLRLSQLRAERNRKGLSQVQLAELAGVSESTVERAERGEPIRADCALRLCDYFGKTLEQLGLQEDGNRPEQGSNLALYTPDTEDDVMKKISRRAAIGLGANLGAALLLTPHTLNSDEIDRLLWMSEAPSQLDEPALSSFEALTEHQWRLLYSGLPWPTILSAVLGHLQSIEPFLKCAQPTSIEQRLWSIASQQAQMACEIYFDARRYPEAQAYFTFAVRAAQRANNQALTAVALARINIAPTDRDRLQETRPIREVAYRLAAQSATTTTRCWVAAREAEILANLGASDACFRALEKAEYITNHQQTAGDDPYWTQFGPASLAGYKGVCYVRLKQSEKAQRILLEALTSLPSRQATTLTDLAASYAQQDEVEEACKRAIEALALIEQKRSVGTLERIYDVRTQLNQWEASPHVQQLDERLLIARLHIAPSL